MSGASLATVVRGMLFFLWLHSFPHKLGVYCTYGLYMQGPVSPRWGIQTQDAKGLCYDNAATNGKDIANIPNGPGKPGRIGICQA